MHNGIFCEIIQKSFYNLALIEKVLDTIEKYALICYSMSKHIFQFITKSIYIFFWCKPKILKENLCF